MAQYIYTEPQEKKILKSMIMIVDTREQRNEHIIEYLNQRKIPYIKKALKFGDYLFFLPKQDDEKLAIPRDLHFSDEFVVERKASLDELAGNMKRGSKDADKDERTRIENEMLRKGKAKMLWVIERGTWADLKAGNYRSEYGANALTGSIMAFMHRYDLHVDFVPSEASAWFIYCQCYYHMRERIRTGFCGIREEIKDETLGKDQMGMGEQDMEEHQAEEVG